eukprot:CAMPEP_0175169542 /NCGR_PEP_ID=MMETSP0087-20121206/29659_1 /TAXON_ID=136419 /ORGANISM="Unknown Unknown, Strain D1" /LENGTH=257 /DNA_ID=CAMNT_0016459961 /DNA_START=122 /DNA_END=895 /DNA_ORIENTATION=-
MYSKDYFGCCDDSKTLQQCITNDLGLVHFILLWLFTHLCLAQYVYYFQEFIDSPSDPTWAGVKVVCWALLIFEVVQAVFTTVMACETSGKTLKDAGYVVSVLASLLTLLVWLPQLFVLCRFRNVGNISTTSLLVQALTFAMCAAYQAIADADADSYDLYLAVPLAITSVSVLLTFVYSSYLVRLNKRAEQTGQRIAKSVLSHGSTASSPLNTGGFNRQASLEDDEYLLLDEGSWNAQPNSLSAIDSNTQYQSPVSPE